MFALLGLVCMGLGIAGDVGAYTNMHHHHGTIAGAVVALIFCTFVAILGVIFVVGEISR